MSKTNHFTTFPARRSAKYLIAALVLVAFPLSAIAQSNEVLTTPPNIVVPNYEGVPVGPFAGLEASAYVARTDDPSAAWFNPAGLSRAKGAQISGSAGLYQYTKVSPSAYPGAGSSVEHVPNLVGFTLQKDQLTLGAAILTPVSWAQTTNLELFVPSGTNLERFAYTADSDFNRRVIATSAGYDSKKGWRLGGGLTFMYTSLKMTQTVSDRIAEPTGLRTLLVSSIVRGSDMKVGAVGGFQADLKTHIRVGAVVRTSGFSIYRSGTATLDGTDKNGSASEGSSFFDPHAEFHYKLPIELTGGIAWVATRGEIETAIHGYTSVSPYSLISSPVQAILYHDDGLGGPPTFTQQPFAGLTSASKAIANVSVGGHYKVFSDRELRVHFGITTDLSPVAPEDQVFDRVDLTAWTVGLSGRVSKLTYAAGFNYRSGTSDSITVSNLISRQPVNTDIHIRTMGMIYSVSYQF
jgi:hypothetical protein